MVVGVLYLERFSSSLYLKRGRGKNLSHPATLRIFLMLSSVMYDETLRTVFDIRRSENMLSCLRRKKRRGRPEEQIFHAGSEVPVSHCEGGRGWWLREEEVENK